MTEFVNLPRTFCVESYKGNQRGYGFLEAIPENIAPTANPHGTNITNALKPERHMNRYFRIINDALYVLQHRSVDWKNTMTRKGHGTVNRTARWINTGTALRYGDTDYPVIRIAAS